MHYDTDYENSKLDTFPAILTPNEVMDILRIGKNSVYFLLNSGKLEGFRIGRTWRIPSNALEHLIHYK